MTKAYEDAEFMLSDEARSLRLLSEYLEPRARLKELNVHRALIFWGSARLRPIGPDPGGDTADFYAEARELAARMTRWTMQTHDADSHYYVCTGGGPGIMEAANRGAADVNRDLSMGYNIELPHEQGANAYISDALNFEFKYFFMRKFWFMNVAKALIIFPGGFGTMDELFETLTLVQTGKIKRPLPMLLFGTDYWDRVLHMEEMVAAGTISAKDPDLLHRSDSVDEAFEWLVQQLEANE